MPDRPEALKSMILPPGQEFALIFAERPKCFFHVNMKKVVQLEHDSFPEDPALRVKTFIFQGELFEGEGIIRIPYNPN